MSFTVELMEMVFFSGRFCEGGFIDRYQADGAGRGA